MLFNAREFEHHFTNALLKKGLRLFEKGQLEAQGRLGTNEFKFLLENQYELHLKKKGDQILDYTCSCNKSAFCEHLCAVLFYFQKDALGIVVKNQLVAAAPSKRVVGAIPHLGQFLKPIDQPSLIKFIEEYAQDNALFKETVFAYFSGEEEGNAFNFYCVTIKNILALFAPNENLQQKHLDDVFTRIRTLLEKRGNSHVSLYFLRLAIVTEVPAIFNARLTGNENELLKLLEESCKELDRYYTKGLSAIGKKAWQNATVYFLKKATPAYSPVFSFLLPRAINLLKDKEAANELKKLLERKQLKLIRSGNHFNHLEIVKLQLAIKEAELFKTPFPFKKYNQDPELMLAKAELYFCGGKVEKAFSYLEENYVNVEIDFPAGLRTYSEYIISKAREKQKPELEIKYLKKQFIFGLHIVPHALERYLELIPEKKRGAQLNELIAGIKSESKGDVVDKISVILLKAGRLNDLVKELKKQKNRFNLVNKIAVQSLPTYTPELLAVYGQHLASALHDAKYTNYQQPLFMLAKKYLDHLPRPKANELVAELLKQVEYTKPLYSLILGYYPLAVKSKVKPAK